VKIYHDLEQGSPEWSAVRMRNFTASELGPFAVEPVKITYTIKEIEAYLDAKGIKRVGKTKRDELIDLIPDPESHTELCDGARTAIIDKITQEKRLAIESRPFDLLTLEDQIWLERQKELADKEERSFGFNIPVKYGKELEPFARDYYADKTGFDVVQVGFIEHDSGGFGCSPDGLISKPSIIVDGELTWDFTHGLEIKCPVPETHLAWLLDGGLPDCHKLQCHAGMAVTGLNRWDFLSYCPGDPPLLVTVLRDDFTDRLEVGLKTLVAEKAKMKAELARLWKAEFGEVKS